MKIGKKNFLNSIYFQIILWYLIITFIGSLLLFLSFTHQKDTEINFLNSLFISASAFSDTGLSTVSISETFNYWGQIIIFVLILLGGAGWFTVKFFVITYIFFRISNRKTELSAKEEIGLENNFQTKTVLKVTFFSMIIVVLFFGIIFGLTFALIEPDNLQNVDDPNLYHNWGKSFWTGFFHANSSINNAGFDIFNGNASLSAYYGNYFIQILTIFLFIFGGIGFVVIYDLWRYFVNRCSGKKFNFSLFTKVAVVSYFVIAFAGLFLVYSFESIAIAVDKENAFLTADLNGGYGGTGVRFWALTFNTFSTRNAGFSTIDLNLLSPLSRITNIFMMFIGSGPGSTAGGIRTTTTAVLIVAFLNNFHKNKNVILFNREIPKKTIKFAINILIASLVLVIVGSMLVALDEIWIGNNDDFKSYLDALYITASAFGTVGLSTVELNNLNFLSIIILIIIMFIGQVGIAAVLKLFKKNNEYLQKFSGRYSIFLQEDLNLG